MNEDKGRAAERFGSVLQAVKKQMDRAQTSRSKVRRNLLHSEQ